MDILKLFYAVIFFLYGIVVGSFLNVCIYRMPIKENIVTMPSHCPSCDHKLNILDLFPLLSYLVLRGRCRYCKAKISIQYPIIELLNGILWAICFLFYDLSVIAVLNCLFLSALIVLSGIDIGHKIVPDKILIFMFVLALPAIYFSDNGIITHIIGFFLVSVPFLIVALLTNGIGGGDIKLYAVIGLFLGWKITIVSLLITLILASIFSIILMIAKKATKKSQIPLVPFISIGTFISLLFGNEIIAWYMSFF